MKKFDSSLYFITDSTNYTEEEFLFRVEQALKGGATLLQLREKEKSTREYMDLAEKVHEIAKRYNVPLIIDDRVDVALAIDAEGVHVGASDMPVATARKLMGENKIVGAIYPTTTKVVTVLTSTETLEAITKAVPIPVNAIGGLNKDNIDILKGIGISGICVVSAIMKAENPEKEAETLLSLAKDLIKND